MSARRPRSPLHRRILWGLLLGAVAGAGANALAAGRPGVADAVALLADGVAHPIGQVFLRALFLVVVPLVFCSISVGVAGLGGLSGLGRVGSRTLLFFLITTAFSAVLGLGLMELLRPGDGFDAQTTQELMAAFGGDAERLQTAVEAQRATTVLATANKYLDMFLPRNVLGAVVQMQMLPLIVFALLIGAALTSVDAQRRQHVVLWLEGVGEAMVVIVGFAMKLAPYAVFCLIFSVVARFGLDLLGKLAWYVAIVMGAYVVQLLVLYPLLLATLARRRPLEFLRRSIPVLVTAFSTSSSAATLPTSLSVARTSLGIRPAVAGFVLPLGATMNMNGTALFEGALVLFLAQVFGVHLDLGEQFLVLLLCVFSAIGAAGIPGGSLPLIMIILAQVGVPPDGIAIVLGVDRLLDMGRTVTNVAGDLVCAAYVDRAEGPAPDS